MDELRADRFSPQMRRGCALKIRPPKWLVSSWFPVTPSQTGGSASLAHDMQESLAANAALAPLVEHFSRTILCEARGVRVFGFVNALDAARLDFSHVIDSRI